MILIWPLYFPYERSFKLNEVFKFRKMEVITLSLGLSYPQVILHAGLQLCYGIQEGN